MSYSDEQGYTSRSQIPAYKHKSCGKVTPPPVTARNPQPQADMPCDECGGAFPRKEFAVAGYTVNKIPRADLAGE